MGMRKINFPPPKGPEPLPVITGLSVAGASAIVARGRRHGGVDQPPRSERAHIMKQPLVTPALTRGLTLPGQSGVIAANRLAPESDICAQGDQVLAQSSISSAAETHRKIRP